MDAWFPRIQEPLFTEAELSKIHRCGQLAKRISRKWDLRAEQDKLDRQVVVTHLRGYHKLFILLLLVTYIYYVCM